MVQVDRVSDPQSPGRFPPTRGWSLSFLRTGATAVGMSALVALMALAPAATFAADFDPATDMNSMYNTTLYSGAQAWWAAGFTGKGVDVAVIDTGVSPVAGLNTPGKIINGPDLSFESQNPSFRYLDTNGHGTFMAGLIAGRDSTLTAPYAQAPASAYRGMAPDARIVNVKVGVADGGTDVSQVIAAINWVVKHRNDIGMNIRVISMSYGTNSLQPYGVDPLSFAVEQAWKKGIIVVAAAGNSGYQAFKDAPGLANPAYNPFVIAVGGSDSMGTATLADDVVGDYSANSSACSMACRLPDIVAPGSHLQGLRVPNSYLDLNHPGGRLGDRYFRGSGTSQSAAIASGAAALILQKYPKATPDQVKAYLKLNAYSFSGFSSKVKGDGEINLTAMLAQSPPTKNYAQKHLGSTGNGSLEDSRGFDHVSDDGIALTGEIDIFGKSFDSAKMATLEVTDTSWVGGSWNGSSWTGNSWSGSSWSSISWSGNSWSGNSWSGNSWSGNSWSGSSWSGNSWSGNSWSGSSWSGNSWSTGSWD